MDVLEFRKKIKPNTKLVIEGKEFIVRQVIKFRFDDGNIYFKLFLNDDYVFADDSNENIFILVKEVKTPFQLPFPEELDYDGKHFKFSYQDHAVAEEFWGEEIFKKGDSEKFWDYKADDGSYLSLGINDNTKQKLDFYGKIIDSKKIEIK